MAKRVIEQGKFRMLVAGANGFIGQLQCEEILNHPMTEPLTNPLCHQITVAKWLAFSLTRPAARRVPATA